MKMIMDASDIIKGDGNYEGKFLVKKLDSLKDKFQEARYQLVVATGGFGCYPNKNGSAVFVIDCCDGESYREERYHILGVASERAIKQWQEEYGDFDEAVYNYLERKAK